VNPYMNEDVAWQRLKDAQREMENSQRLAAGIASGLRAIVWLAARRVALVRPAARRSTDGQPAEARSASDEASAA
jgi:hypothetical protein